MIFVTAHVGVMGDASVLNQTAAKTLIAAPCPYVNEEMLFSSYKKKKQFYCKRVLIYLIIFGWKTSTRGLQTQLFKQNCETKDWVD